MRRSLSSVSAFALVALALAFATPGSARAELSRDDTNCGASIGREARRYSDAKHSAIVECNNDIVESGAGDDRAQSQSAQ